MFIIRIYKNSPIFRLSEEIQFLCCQFIYEKFRNEMISEDRRQMIINVFLIPILSYCTKSVILKTYMSIIDFIIKTINVNLLANDCGKVLHTIIFIIIKGGS